MTHLASLSLDMDNLWAYQRVKGDPGWKDFPSYLEIFLPRFLNYLDKHQFKTTFFVVGQDAAFEANTKWMREIANKGHEFGNHSFHHEPWMTQRGARELKEELEQTHQAIEKAAGKAPIGFRGPGFCMSRELLEAIKELGYTFDASLLPSVLGPVARLYYLLHAGQLKEEEKEKRGGLFGKFSNGFLPIKPFSWELKNGKLLEIPVTTIPMLRVPFHLSYVLWLSSFSKNMALAYFRAALLLCKIRGVSPSILLHPLDFLGGEDVPSLSFFPGMNLSGKHKMEVADAMASLLKQSFRVVPMSEHAASLKDAALPVRSMGE